MRRLNLHLFTFAAFLLVILVASCSKTPKYTKMIPEDATVIVRIDAKAGMQQTGVSDNEQMQTKFKDVLKKANLSTKMTNLMQDIIDDPKKLGLDLRDPLFFFVTLKEEAGLVGSVYDKDDFAAFLDLASKEDGSNLKLKEKDGFNYIEEYGTVLVFNSDWFYIGGNTKVDDVIEAFKSDDTKHTFYESEYLKDMDGKDGFVQVLMNLNSVKSLPAWGLMSMYLPSDLDITKLVYLYSFGVDKNTATLTTQVLTQDEKCKQYISDCYANLKDITSEQKQYASKDGAAIMMNMDFQKLISSFNFSALLQLLPEDQKSLADKVLKSIDGEGVIALNEFNMSGKYPTVSAYIKTKDNSLMTALEQNVPSDFEKTGDHQYKTVLSYAQVDDPAFPGYKTDDTNSPLAYMILGQQKDRFFVASGKDPKPESKASNPLTEVKGKGVYAYLSAKLFENILKDDDSPIVKKIIDFIKIYDYAEYYLDGESKAIIKIYGRDTEKNILGETISNLVSIFETIGSVN